MSIPIRNKKIAGLKLTTVAAVLAACTVGGSTAWALDPGAVDVGVFGGYVWTSKTTELGDAYNPLDVPNRLRRRAGPRFKLARAAATNGAERVAGGGARPHAWLRSLRWKSGWSLLAAQSCARSGATEEFMPAERSSLHQRILAVDDDDVHLAMLQHDARLVPDWTVELACMSDPRAAIARLLESAVDVVRPDYRLGDSAGLTGLDMMRQLCQAGCARPIIVPTGTADSRATADLSREGADDYLDKSDLSPATLHRALRLVLGRHRAEAEPVEARRRTAAEPESNVVRFEEVVQRHDRRGCRAERRIPEPGSGPLVRS